MRIFKCICEVILFLKSEANMVKCKNFAELGSGHGVFVILMLKIPHKKIL